jgi:hypothetical protein
MAENEQEMTASYKGRKLRIQILKDEVRKNKRMPINDIYKFALNRWLLSMRIIDAYIREITATGDYKIVASSEGDYIEYVGSE